ncbi:Transcriptional regulatory protein RcsB [Paraburkholderia ultramafica]|uniref:Transcriptional regulatory protein RcsB n=2 Tax=Paraburkholderia ultramafica TaxID=1544867 RepID=A0A6S7BHE2_9BURK|nr:Transcriptional regulatory protein RcsB [Paraburkholderia ultramafica]
MHLRIILADDHPFVLLGMRAMLATRDGVTLVGQALTPTSLLELLQRNPCDVLVTDLAMPDPNGAIEDGLGLVRRIRRNWPRLRVVVITALANPSILHAVVSDNSVSALSKTESMDELWQAILAGVSGARYLGRSIVEALAHPQDDERPPLPALRLSDRQTEVVKRLVSGQSISEIAAALGCHRRTVSRQKREAMARLGVTNDPGLFSRVYAYGILKIESHI